MKGYIKFDGQRVEFGMSVPLPEGKGFVDLDIDEVLAWGQRVEPQSGSVIGFRNGTWFVYYHESGDVYEKVGIYLGQHQVLTARAR